MNVLRAPRLFQVASSQCRLLTRCKSATSSNDKPPCLDDNIRPYTQEEPYWHKMFPDQVAREFDDIPGPRFLPVIGHEWRYWIGQYNRDRIHHTFAKLLDQYGYVVKEHIGRERSIVHLFHPEDILLVYRNDGPHPSRLSNRIMERYRRERPHQYSSAGLGPSNGEEWANFRRQFNQAQGVFLKRGHERDLETVADDLVTKVAGSLDKNGEADIMPDFYRWTLEGVGVVTLNRRLGCLDPEPNPEADQLIEAAHITNDAIFRTEMMSSGHEKQYRRLVPAQDYFSNVVRQYIDKAVTEEDTLLKTIVTPESNMKDVQTFVLDLFQGGIHTTAVSAAFALYHLALNKGVQEKFRKQLMAAMPSKQTRYEDTDIKDSEYLIGILYETLRLNPPTIGNGRILQVPLILGGYNVPAGNMVLLHHMVASRREENFDHPLVFKPERFAPPSSPDYSPHLYKKGFMASAPFGFGLRGCIGRHLANAQMSLAVVKFVRNFEISYHHDKIDTVNRLHNEPDKPMRLRFKPLPN